MDSTTLDKPAPIHLCTSCAPACFIIPLEVNYACRHALPVMDLAGNKLGIFTVKDGFCPLVGE